MPARTLHRPYLATSLAFVSLGVPLGLLMLAGLTGWHHTRAWGSHVVAHAQFQVVGFVALFTLGMALQLLAPTAVGRRESALSLGLLASGTAVASGAGLVPWLGPPGTALQLAGLALHARLFWRGQRWQGGNLGFFLTGQLWLAAALVTSRLELVLWGFACLYVLGAGFRLHPRLLGARRPPEWLQATVLVGWNAGLGLGSPVLLAACAGLVAWHWRHARQALWLRALFPSLVGACLLPAPLARHALATGFLLPMLIGMALELLPAFLRRPAPRRLQGWLVGTLLAATALRLGGQAGGWSQAYLLGGCTQVLVLSIFVTSIGSVIQRPLHGSR